MNRGDTLFFVDQVVQDLVTGQLSAVPAGQPLPSGAVPVDITGFSIWFTAKSEYPDPDNRAVAQLDNHALGGVVITQATLGKFSVTMPALATRDFPDSDVALVFDIQVEDLAGRVSTIEKDTLTVAPDVTRTSA